MIGIERYSAVFSRKVKGLAGLAHVQITAPLSDGKMASPCAAYACRAFELMAPETAGLALVCVSGPTGSTVRAFDKAWQASPDGKLVGEGFGKRRARRIHPFTLVKSLQNQVPATLSMNYGIKGPCLNVLEGATSLAYLLPNISALLAAHHPVLLVLASAGYREEERAKHHALLPERRGLEGSACFLLTRNGALGYLEPALPDGDPGVTEDQFPISPVLHAGLEILHCIAENPRERVIALKDFGGHRAYLRWRSN